MTDWFEKRTYGDLVDEAAARWGEREALYFEGRRWTFAEFKTLVDTAAKGLMALGVQPGDKVSIWITNRPEWLICMYAIFKIGAIMVPVNTRLRSEDIRYILTQSNTSTLITVDRSGPVEYFAMVQELLPGLGQAKQRTAEARMVRAEDFPDLQRVVVSAERTFPGTYAWAEVMAMGERGDDAALAERQAAVDPDDTAFIMYTSGTTGFPKGVMRSHNLIRNVTDQANRMAMTFDDVLLSNLPLFHVFGLSNCAIMSLVTGARQVLTETFDPVESMDLIQQERVTYVQGVDTQFQDLCVEQERHPRDIRSLRVGFFAAGMASSVPAAERTQRVLVPTLSGFGMTECGVGAALSFLTDSTELRCAASGFPLPGYEYKVIDPKTNRSKPPGEPGELCVHGYGVMQGYYKKPEETAKAIDADGWLHTGDMAIIRPDGHLRFMGRYKDMLRTGGENVDPMEVEGYLLQHPAVFQVAVVGLDDERLGQVGVAYVQPQPGKPITAQELMDYMRGKIASFKIPRHIVLVEDFPMTGSGKIQKVKLRAAASDQFHGPKAQAKA